MYVWVMLPNNEKLEPEMDGQFGAMLAVQWAF